MREVLKIDEWVHRKNPQFSLVDDYVVERLNDDVSFGCGDFVMIKGDYDYYEIIGFSKNNVHVLVLSNANNFEFQVEINSLSHIQVLKNLSFSG